MFSNFVFQNASLVCTTAISDVYTCPSSTTAIVFTAQAANVTANSDILTVVWTNASNGNAVTRLAYQVPVPATESQGMITGRVVLHQGDKIRAFCGTPNSIELILGILELS